MNSNPAKDIKYLFLIYLVSPFISLIIAFKFFNIKVIKNIIWAFYVFFGYVLVSSIKGTDVHHYTLMFEFFSQLSFNDKINYFAGEVGIDYFRAFSFHLVSYFTSSTRIYFAFIGFVYGFFYSRIIGMILKKITKPTTFIDKFFIFSYIFIIPFYSLQFVRFSTAIVVFLYFIFKYFTENNSKWNLIFAAICSLFVHFSFILPIISLAIYLFIPKKFNILFYAFLITSIFMIFDFGAIKVIIETYLPTALESKKAYLNEDYATKVVSSSEATNWYIKFKGDLLKYITIILLFYIKSLIKKQKNIINKYNSLLCFGLFFGSIANIISIVPSGFRFLNVSYPIIWFVFTIVLINNNTYKNNFKIKSLVFVFFVFQLIVGIRMSLDSIPLDFFLGNPITILFNTADIPIIDFIK